jgi:hypothetical protein
MALGRDNAPDLVVPAGCHVRAALLIRTSLLTLDRMFWYCLRKSNASAKD